MNATLMHDLIFYVMYFSLAAALVIIIERAIWFAWTQRQAKQLACVLTAETRTLPDSVTRRSSVPLRAVQPVLARKAHASAEALSDEVDEQYLLSKSAMTRGLWLLETVVTAAPLLGLLGTVMGIIDTFKALAAAGVSDASQVSAGMGTALYATGLGIAIALLCLVSNNFLQNRMERINELLKVLLLRAATPVQRAAGKDNQAEWENGVQRYA
ncbi:MotA/TolQ/ExbB proton channel family protein [Kalamiella sp. sgz302252]|uniref:MotA/TolQ/ExbB proton channel family protein n=1 Tax=Pantoea sp. sgz302252 TaxID=3341827 RepID=UPI0036D430B9